jgi:hypothetical protein
MTTPPNRGEARDERVVDPVLEADDEEGTPERVDLREERAESPTTVCVRKVKVSTLSTPWEGRRTVVSGGVI